MSQLLVQILQRLVLHRQNLELSHKRTTYPMRRAMLGLSVGKAILKERSAPACKSLHTFRIASHVAYWKILSRIYLLYSDQSANYKDAPRASQMGSKYYQCCHIWLILDATIGLLRWMWSVVSGPRYYCSCKEVSPQEISRLELQKWCTGGFLWKVIKVMSWQIWMLTQCIPMCSLQHPIWCRVNAQGLSWYFKIKDCASYVEQWVWGASNFTSICRISSCCGSSWCKGCGCISNEARNLRTLQNLNLE